MSTAIKADPATPAGSADSLSRRRPLADRGFAWLALAAGLLVLAILIGIAVSTAQQGANWFSTAGFKGIFSTVWDVSNNQFGMMAFVYGTVISSVIALVIAVPVSLGVALLLTEVVPRRWGQPIVVIIDLLAVVPSVVWGLWGILVLEPWLQPIYTSIASGVRGPADRTASARRRTSIVGMSIATGHASKHAPHSVDANGNDAFGSPAAIPVSCGERTAPMGPGYTDP